MGTWLKTLGEGAWGIVSALVGITVFFVIGAPLSGWFWGWLMEGNHALGLIAAAIVAGAVHLHDRTTS